MIRLDLLYVLDFRGLSLGIQPSHSPSLPWSPEADLYILICFLLGNHPERDDPPALYDIRFCSRNFGSRPRGVLARAVVKCRKGIGGAHLTESPSPKQQVPGRFPPSFTCLPLFTFTFPRVYWSWVTITFGWDKSFLRTLHLASFTFLDSGSDRLWAQAPWLQCLLALYLTMSQLYCSSCNGSLLGTLTLRLSFTNSLAHKLVDTLLFLCHWLNSLLLFFLLLTTVFMLRQHMHALMNLRLLLSWSS